MSDERSLALLFVAHRPSSIVRLLHHEVVGDDAGDFDGLI
jgi:hypothetical protein